MKWSDLRLRARAILLRSRAESELDEELSFHLEMEARKHRAAGLDASASRGQAAIAFGGLEQNKERCRDARGTRWLDDFLHDFRFAWRTLGKDRGYTGAAVTALAVGIGLNTALFTLFSSVVLKPLPVREPERLVSVWRTSARNQRGGPLSFADYVYYRDRSTVFSSLAAEVPEHLRLAAIGSGSLPDNGVAEPLMGLFVTANYLRTFGVNPVAGRDLHPEEDLLTAGPYPAMLSENYWERRFGRDPAILGQSLLLSGIQTTVIGITPRDFMGTRPYVPDVWIAASALGNPQRRATDRNTLSSLLTGRLKSSTTPRQAQAELAVLAENLRREYPAPERQWNVRSVPSTRFGPAHEVFILLYGILQVAMALVLLIACSNAAGLLLGKAAGRQRELAVRLSIGATRGRLVRQLITEGILMALLAGVGAFFVTWQALQIIARKLSAMLAVGGGTIAVDLTPDPAVFGYILAICILAGVSFTLAPALQTTRPDLSAALKNENTLFGVRRKSRLHGWMVAAQTAVCLALLIGAGLLTSNSVRLLSIDPGFATREVLAMTVSSPQELGYSAARARDLQIRLEQRLRAIPGVLSVGFSSRIPLDGNITVTRVAPQTTGNVSADLKQFPYTYASGDYFQTLGVPLLRGRAFTAQELAANAPVGVVSEALARALWPAGDALGQHLALGSRTEVHFAGRRAPFSTATEVIGVAREIYSSSLTAPDNGAVYLPKPSEEWNGYVLVRFHGDASALAGFLVHEVHDLEPRLPVSVETLQHMIATGETAGLFRGGAAIFGALGLLGFALAAVGIYSMVAYSVSRQTREIGIRMALGAQKRDVVRLLLTSGGRWIGAGLFCGAAFGTVLSRVLASQLLLEGRQFLDPSVILAVSAGTAVLALFAAWLPARRAAGLNPALTLRVD